MRTKNTGKLGILFLCFLFLVSSQFSAISKIKNKKESVSSKEEEKKEDKKKKEPIKEADYTPVLLGALLESPGKYIDKKVKFRGRFSSFTTLALDYDKALRKSKDYISICLFRTDSKIPLSELKLAYPVKEAKEDEVIRDLEEGDLLDIYGKVFSAALDEPWVDIISMKKIESASKKDKTAKDKKSEKSDRASERKKKNKKDDWSWAR